MTDPLGNIDAYEWCEAYRRASAEIDRLRAALAEALEAAERVRANGNRQEGEGE